MDLTSLQQLIVTFVPAITILLGFLASCFGVLKQLKKSDLTKIADLMKDENSELNKKFTESVNLMRQLISENEYLKHQCNELIGELKRIADYEYNDKE